MKRKLETSKVFFKAIDERLERIIHNPNQYSCNYMEVVLNMKLRVYTDKLYIKV